MLRARGYGGRRERSTCAADTPPRVRACGALAAAGLLAVARGLRLERRLDQREELGRRPARPGRDSPACHCRRVRARAARTARTAPRSASPRARARRTASCAKSTPATGATSPRSSAGRGCRARSPTRRRSWCSCTRSRVARSKRTGRSPGSSPASTTSRRARLPPGAIVGKNSYGEVGYKLCPPNHEGLITMGIDALPEVDPAEDRASIRARSTTRSKAPKWPGARP